MSSEGIPCRARAGSAGLWILTIGALALATSATATAQSPTAPEAVAPDLVPVRATTSPNVVYETEVVSVSVTIENRGDYAAWAAAIDLIDVGPSGNVVRIPGESALSAPLDPGASVVFMMPAFVAVGVGGHTLTIRLSSVMPPEANATNNALSVPMNVLPRPGGGGGTDGPSNSIRIEALEGLGIGGLVVIVLIALVGFALSAPSRRKSSNPLVPPPPEPEDRRPPPIWPP